MDNDKDNGTITEPNPGTSQAAPHRAPLAAPSAAPWDPPGVSRYIPGPLAAHAAPDNGADDDAERMQPEPVAEGAASAPVPPDMEAGSAQAPVPGMTFYGDASVPQDARMEEHAGEDAEAPDKCKKRRLLILLLLLLLAAVPASCFLMRRSVPPSAPDTDQNPLKIADGVDADRPKKDEGMENHTEIPVYKAFKVSTDEPYIYLGNPDINDVYFGYAIRNEDGSVLYETDAVVEPGRAFEIDLRGMLEPGEHRLSIDISSYDLKTQEPCNGATQEVDVTVLE